ncbi:myosin-4 [Biomphalaria glabrata]|nr:myosin-4 [Biomphalaria glabrata]
MTKLTMPPATTLNFYRKRQTFAALASERPQSLQSVYTIVREVVSSVETRLLNLETSYYEPNGKMEAEIKQWQIPLQLLLRPARQSGLHSLGQLNELAERQLDPTDVLTIDEHSLNLIQSLVNKALKATRVGFSESIFFVEKLLEYMSRYCLSFSPLDGDAYLETATNYEKQRRDLANAIRRNLQVNL